MQENANNPPIQGFQLGKKIFLTGNIFFSNWAFLIYAIKTSILMAHHFVKILYCKGIVLSLIPLIYQIHHHLYHHILFLGAALGNHQRKGNEGVIGQTLSAIGTV